ncbi:hypothetical protein GKZ68_03055 [Hymenobacter sp. BRD128]|uniref:hypothetical protein n=1 Tax=Hymenobacter sp. BRD128 TaxID=2675878 RepID=UPI0015639131|nr:hypothetical protein [Hymenobacter sp. BRD128]QKG55708.1 hypothetical protein GKZ68_03055 [Hymenobacter sp. BRD128]
MLKLLRLSPLQRAGLLLAALLASPAAHAQLAYSGPPGATLMQQAKMKLAAGDRAGAAAAYQQAYAAYTSVDDSDGMKAALAGKAAVSGRVAGLAALRPAVGAARPAAPVAAPPAGPAPVAGRLVGGKPVGLFFGTKTVLGHFITMTYYFGPDGVAYENPPGLSVAALAATPARSKGPYSVSGKTLSIAWPGDRKAETAAMNSLTNGFSWSLGSIFSAVGPFQSPSQLVGTFEGGTSTFATAVGQAVVSSTLTFRADGTYQGSGVATVTTATAGSVAETGGTSQQAGHWSLSGWYLTLTDAQGRTTRGIAYPVGTGSQVTLFNYNGMAYQRQ